MERDPDIEKAKAWAFKAHHGQPYGRETTIPHTYHLEQAVGIIDEFFKPTDEHYVYLKVATWLHDTVEDTTLTYEDIRDEFGKTIARWVFAVSDDPTLTRKERHKLTYPKIRAAGREALAVKLADRIANVRHCIGHNHGLLGMYKNEYPEFRAYLRVPGELKSMWAELDRLHEHFVEEVSKGDSNGK